MTPENKKRLEKRWNFYNQCMKNYRSDCLPQLSRETRIAERHLSDILSGKVEKTALLSEEKVMALRIRAARARKWRKKAAPHSRAKLQAEFHISGETFNRLLELGENAPLEKRLTPAQAFLRGFR